MLETDEVEDDYFTPISSTPLSNIFGSTGVKSPNEETSENASLKYTPPKQHNITPEPEERKASQCIYACALFGYEWSNNVYTSKGKLGFAILKIIKTGQHNIVLYDSNKTTLSCTTVSPTSEVTVKEEIYISYFDNLQKYWSLRAAEEEVKSIASLLKNLNVNIKYSSKPDKGPPEPQKHEHVETHNEIEPGSTILEQVEKESDTDSSVNRKTKASILSRMASMGHAILPPHTLSTEKTSDSSDTNEANTHPKPRHKPIKSIVKRHAQEKLLSETQSSQNVIESVKSIMPKTEQCVDNIPQYTYLQGPLVPVTHSNMVPYSSNANDMSIFLSEHRISNSELRINMNRMTDKVDQILDKIKDIGNVDKTSSTSNFQNEILQKLLTEYENKIKMYEEVIKAKPINNDASKVNEDTVCDSLKQGEEIELYKHKIAELEQKYREKQEEISRLRNELIIVRNESRDSFENLTLKNLAFIKEIEKLKHLLELKNEELLNMTAKHENMSVVDDNTIATKIKNIMNDTFQAVAMNFEDNQNYSGENIKSIIAKVIKKVTLESI